MTALDFFLADDVVGKVLIIESFLQQQTSQGRFRAKYPNYVCYLVSYLVRYFINEKALLKDATRAICFGPTTCNAPSTYREETAELQRCDAADSEMPIHRNDARSQWQWCRVVAD